MASLVPVLIFAAVLFTTAAESSEPQSATVRGREYSSWWSENSMKLLQAAAGPGLRQIIADSGGAAAMAAGMKKTLGEEAEILDEFSFSLNGATVYHRLATYTREPVGLTTVVWDEDGTVQSAGVRPSSLYPEHGEPTEVDLPFGNPRRGEWLTFWGGSNEARNYHVVSKDQRYAFDFVVAKNGRTFEGPSDQLSSYYCWNDPVIAPADGVVTEAVDRFPDNAPGEMQSDHPAGNHVVIRHAADVHSVIAHLQSGSVTVEKGERIERGRRIGNCGNSGRTSEPHVHFHLQTLGAFQPSATGLPVMFRNARIDGRSATADEPVRGQVVSPVTDVPGAQ